VFHLCLEFVLEKRVVESREDIVNLVSNSSFCLELEFRVSAGC